MKNKLDKLFKSQSENDKIGHAYLIANTNLENISEELSNVLSDYIFGTKIELNNNQDIFILEPENEIIKKNQIYELKFFLNKTSQISGKKVYIINHTELLNSYSSNSLLKILEEPENNIFSFLITSNIDAVIKTIKSRCQILFLASEDNETNELENVDLYQQALDIISLIEENASSFFPYAYQLVSVKNDKKYMRVLLDNMLKIYEQCLLNNLSISTNCLKNEKFIKISSMMNNDDIIKKIVIINKFLNYLNFNLNNSLFIDKLLLELGDAK